MKETGFMIRDVRDEDANQILEIYSPIVEESAISFEVTPPSLTEMQQRIRKADSHFPWLVMEHNDQLCGYVYAKSFRDREAYRYTVETTVYVHPGFQQRGIGCQLLEELLKRLQSAGFRTALAGIALPNPASVSLHEKVGFKPIGVFPAIGWKFETWHDVGFWTFDLASSD